MSLQILFVLTVLAVSAQAGVISAPLVAAPFASSQTAHVVHHSIAAPVASYVAAPAAPLVAAPVAAPLVAHTSLPVAARAIVSPYVGSASILLK